MAFKSRGTYTLYGRGPRPIGTFSTLQEAKKAAADDAHRSIKWETSFPGKTVWYSHDDYRIELVEQTSTITEKSMPHRTARETTPDAESAGEQYAYDQIAGDYFENWVREQMLEASKADPSQQLPLETKADALVIAKNMLQQLRWDAERGLAPREIADLIGTDSTTHEDIKEFWVGFRKALDASREGLADELLELKGMSGGSVGEDRRRAPKRLRYSDEQVRAMLAQVPMYREQLLAAAKERGWDRPSVVPITEVHAFLRAQLASRGVGEARRRGVVRAPHHEATQSERPDQTGDWALTQRMMKIYAEHAKLGEYKHNSAVPIGGGTWAFYTQRPGARAEKHTVTQQELTDTYKRQGLSESRRGVVRAFTKSQHHFTNGSNQIENGINVWVSGDEPTRVTISGRDRESAERIVRSWWGSQALHFAWTDSTHADIGRDYTKFTRESRRRR